MVVGLRNEVGEALYDVILFVGDGVFRLWILYCIASVDPFFDCFGIPQG